MKVTQGGAAPIRPNATACSAPDPTGKRDLHGTMLMAWRRAVQIARAAIGVPDYDTYLAHQHQHHPERPPMSYEAFFLERQNARYKGGGGRCC